MPPKASELWGKYCLNVMPVHGGDRKWTCKFCHKDLQGTKTRLVAHLGHIRGEGMGPCIDVSEEAKKEAIEEHSKKKKLAATKAKDIAFSVPYDHALASEVHVTSTFNKSVDVVSSRSIGDDGQTQTNAASISVARVSDEIQVTNSKSSVADQLNARHVVLMQRKKHANRLEMRCLALANLPFNLLKMSCWRDMLEAFSQIGSNHSGLTYKEARTTALHEEYALTKAKTEQISNLWPKYGCTILTDGWVDVSRRKLVNIMVSCCYGTLFLKSIDCSRPDVEGETGVWLAEQIGKVIESIGLNNVVQVITDNASNCVRMGKELEKTYSGLVWTPCAAHSIDLLLEDISELSWFEAPFRKANTIARFFHKRKQANKIFMTFSKLQILRPSKTRFGVIFIVVERLLKVWSALQQTVISWEHWNDSNQADARLVKEYVLDPSTIPSFNLILRIMRPLYCVLRLANKEGSTIGLLYEFMLRCEAVIKKRQVEDQQNKDKYDDVLKCMDARWQKHKRPIHFVAYLLYPLWRESQTYIRDEVMDGWLEYIGRVRTPAECTVLFAQLDAYRNGTGLFSHQLALDKGHQAKPVSWWEHFGCKTRELQAIAIRVLSQDCSSGAKEKLECAFTCSHKKAKQACSWPTRTACVYSRKFENDAQVWVQQIAKTNLAYFYIVLNDYLVRSLRMKLTWKRTLMWPVIDEIDRELYQNFVDEIMDTRRVTRSRTAAARANSNHEEVPAIELVSNPRGRGTKRHRLGRLNENQVVRRSSRLAGSTATMSHGHEGNVSDSAQVQNNLLEVEEIVNYNVNVIMSGSDNDDNYEDAQEDSADVDSTETELSDED